jgi:hypothetical protein
MTEEEKPDYIPIRQKLPWPIVLISAILIIIFIAFIVGMIVTAITTPGDDTNYQQGYDIGYAEGQASRDCDCQLQAGLLTTDEWLECNPEETTDDTKPDKWNEGNTQGFFDGAEDYECP